MRLEINHRGFENSKHESMDKSSWNMWELTSCNHEKCVFMKSLIEFMVQSKLK